MDQPGAQRFILSLYQNLLGRAPQAAELSRWVERATSGAAAEEIYLSFAGSKECRNVVARRAMANGTAARYPPGHFYSPIVDPVEARKYVEPRRPAAKERISELPGIPISNSRMLKFWAKATDCMRATSFSAKDATSDRYHWPNPSYPYGDALILRAMICCERPSQVVEIGCGFSSACMLDAAEVAGLADFSMTCIDPNPERLHALLRPSDMEHLHIIGKPVQEVPASVFAALRSGDILFIDSTHVLKSGSDVCHELFSILPSLAPGVLVHFHDCRYPFEYPEKWIFELNYSWNEIYAIRAFLMYNSEFEILFWNSFFAQMNRNLVEETVPAFARNNPGGALWIRRKRARSNSI